MGELRIRGDEREARRAGVPRQRLRTTEQAGNSAPRVGCGSIVNIPKGRYPQRKVVERNRALLGSGAAKVHARGLRHAGKVGGTGSGAQGLRGTLRALSIRSVPHDTRPSLEAAQRSRERIARARARGTTPRAPWDGWRTFARMGAVVVERNIARFRAECPCGWRAEGWDEVRGEALLHGYGCAGMA